ncbi:MAG: Aspartyl/glutamyl-tRNA(Asn/Gln) amidotransferase subunit B [Candidatus Giovannonibacteria bacterium GW2011_GWA2_44_26]|uniref:Aspartyl/glutamyl-tRNA(Asn/Gln) amidotransferase subunit B n=1 Tax=Candidatus Giovannonibacteria bacterium GW2011_GWA2_44_26 TaxID=1618648 RepID=A0A0G1KWI5_9BACT|nr:MAG: Aspartyl/glutamyl-tRNA(Asn/Gln) amidotransferase subunit B [Candidatus Giovannonibacteria bacterium GW2011_GWA2_44_26]
MKESAHDYRYFPDPDLPALIIGEIPEFDEKVLIASLPELPWQKRERYKRDFGLKDGDIEIYVRQPEWGRLLEEVTEILGNRDLVQLTSNYITSDLKTLVPARSLAEVVEMISAGEISSRGAKDILKIIQEKGGEPRVIANDKNLIQESDGEVLKKIAEEVLRENPGAPIDFLVGQAMKVTKGSANPQVLKEIFIKIL